MSVQYGGDGKITKLLTYLKERAGIQGLVFFNYKVELDKVYETIKSQFPYGKQKILGNQKIANRWL